MHSPDEKYARLGYHFRSDADRAGVFTQVSLSGVSMWMSDGRGDRRVGFVLPAGFSPGLVRNYSERPGESVDDSVRPMTLIVTAVPEFATYAVFAGLTGLGLAAGCKPQFRKRTEPPLSSFKPHPHPSMFSRPLKSSLRSLCARNTIVTLSLVVFLCLAVALPAQTVVSLNKPATVSGSYSSVPQNAVDGDNSTYWNSGGASGWLTVDLGTVYSLDQITVLGGITNNYILSRSIDGNSWFTVASGVWPGGSSPPPPETWNLGGAEGRYIKYESPGNGVNWVALHEMTVTAIPEPSTYAAWLGLGALGFAAYRRRQKRSS